MKRFNPFAVRFSAGTLLVSTTIFAILILAPYAYVKTGHDGEWAAVQSANLSLDYDTEEYFPEWLEPYCPSILSENFEHITLLDLQINDLSTHEPKDVRNLHACAWVHTLYISNVTITEEMFDAISTFPNLRRLSVRILFLEDPNHPIDLRKTTIPGVTITVKEE